MAASNAIVLASASPRRAELLASAGIDFTVVPGDIDETPLPAEEPLAHVLRLAEEKAREAASRTDGRFFIGADTIVLCDGEILGKPADNDAATIMLRKLSGRNTPGHYRLCRHRPGERPGDQAQCQHRSLLPSAWRCRDSRLRRQRLPPRQGRSLCHPGRGGSHGHPDKRLVYQRGRAAAL